MKKIISLGFLTVIILMTACNKVSYTNGYGPMPENYAKIGNSLSKEGEPIEITYRVGHTASECNNSCVIINGEPSHIDCQGRGNACLITIVIWPIGGQPKSPSFNAVVDTVLDLTTEDFFLMPDRSLTVIGHADSTVYLNIPEQFLIRDSVTQQFTLKGLYFSDEAVYSND